MMGGKLRKAGGENEGGKIIGYRKKGMILTLDLILGLLIVFLLLIIVSFSISRGSVVTLPDHQLLVIGSDIVTVLDRQETFDTLDEATIESAVNALLPINYKMQIILNGDFPEATFGDVPPEDRTIISGRHVAFDEINGRYMRISYLIWLSEGTAGQEGGGKKAVARKKAIHLQTGTVQDGFTARK